MKTQETSRLSRFSSIFDRVGRLWSALLLLVLGFPAVSGGQVITNCVPTAYGMVSWWPGEGGFNDVYASGDNVTLLPSGGLTFAPGRVGQAFNFQGTNAALSATPSSRLNVGVSVGLTFEAWIKPADLSRQQAIVEWNNGAGGVGTHFFISIPDLGGLGSIYANVVDTNGVDHILASAPGLLTDGWQHVALTYDKETGAGKIYLNGKLVATKSLGVFTPQTSYAFYLGKRASGVGAGSNYTGLLDEPTLYKRALTETELLAIYSAGSAGKCPGGSPPAIVRQSVSHEAPVGASVTFSVEATGSGPLTYQWLFNDSVLLGRTSASLTLTNIQVANAGRYLVRVSNFYGVAQSSNAVLTVIAGQCAAVSQGVVSWWRGQNNTVDEISKVSGVITPGAGFWAGRVGSAFVFDGNRGVVYLGNPAYLQLQSFTIEAWIRRGSTSTVSYGSGGNGIIFGYGAGGYALFMNAEGRLNLTKVAVGDSPAPVVITDTNFHYVAVTKTGSTAVTFFIDGKSYSGPAIIDPFVFNTPAGIGARADNLDNTFLGTIDEVSVYNRPLTTAELESIYSAGELGKCQQPRAPVFTVQPGSLTVPAGSLASFIPAVTGSEPLGFQWYFSGVPLAGATRVRLDLTNAQPSQSGVYYLAVTNVAGGAVSSNAVLNVVPSSSRTVVRIPNITTIAGSTFSVPIELTSAGPENALSFSLNYSLARLAFVSVQLDTGAAAATLLVNSNQQSLGRVGVMLALPAGSSFGQGTQNVARVVFTALPVVASSAALIGFTNSPIVRQVADTQGNVMEASFINGSVTIMGGGFEGDVSPRPQGDGRVTVADWVLVGRLAAQLEAPMSGWEFQRADTAPRATLGDGIVSVADWVQAGRYAAGLDPLTPAGGPTSQVTRAALTLKEPISRLVASPRQVRIANTTLAPGRTGTVDVLLEAQGGENALGFSVSYDPAALSFKTAKPGFHAGAITLNVNVNPAQAASGRIGIALALPAGLSFSPGTKQLVSLEFAAAPTATGQYSLAFADSPVVRELSDALATGLETQFVGTTMTVDPRPVLGISADSGCFTLTWPAWATDYVLHSSPDAVTWDAVPSVPVSAGDTVTVVIPGEGPARFYRLQQR